VVASYYLQLSFTLRFAAAAVQSGAEVREAFLSFFEGKGHSRLPSSSLVPEDPTVLLTIAGAQGRQPAAAAALQQQRNSSKTGSGAAFLAGAAAAAVEHLIAGQAVATLHTQCSAPQQVDLCSDSS
jgi:hypothetical protein